MPSDLGRISQRSGTVSTGHDLPTDYSNVTPRTSLDGSDGVSTVRAVPSDVTLPGTGRSSPIGDGSSRPLSGTPVTPQRTLPNPRVSRPRAFLNSAIKPFKTFINNLRGTGTASRTGPAVSSPPVSVTPSPVSVTSPPVSVTSPPAPVKGADRLPNASSAEISAHDRREYDADVARAQSAKANWVSGIDLNGAKQATVLASGSFGSVSNLELSGGGPPTLVMKTANPGKEGALETEAKNFELAGDHPNIVKCMGFADVEGQFGIPEHALVLERIDGGKMTDALNKLELLRKGDADALSDAGLTKPLTQREYMGAMQYMGHEIAKGLYHLAEKGLVHNDIRPDNVMISGTTGEVKIVDLGNGIQSGADASALMHPITPGTVSPDVMMGTLTPQHDSFGLGATTYQAIEGDVHRYGGDQPDRVGGQFPRPTLAQQQSNFVSQISNARLAPPRAPIELGIQDQGAEHRPGVAGFKGDYVNFVNSMMNMSSLSRLTASEALAHPFLSDRLLGDQEAADIVKLCFKSSSEGRQTQSDQYSLTPNSNPGATQPPSTVQTDYNLVARPEVTDQPTETVGFPRDEPTTTPYANVPGSDYNLVPRPEVTNQPPETGRFSSDDRTTTPYANVPGSDYNLVPRPEVTNQSAETGRFSPGEPTTTPYANVPGDHPQGPSSS